MDRPWSFACRAAGWIIFAGLCLPNCSGQQDVPDAIQKYVARPEPEFAWKKTDEQTTADGRVVQLQVTSQKWHGIVWKHAVEVYEPAKLMFRNHALLFVTGGSTPRPPKADDIATGLKLATLCGARVVMLHQVPNQPLFDGRKEDDLITETWLRYIESGDESWPLLFPMVKSAVRTMDAIQALAKEEWDTSIDGFVITGASKRGWTSWLTPVVDKRVVATAPIVIDVLNFRAQMKHQLDTWGKFSEQIIDYTSKNLVRGPEERESPRERHLRRMMDPYTYRRQLNLPKLLIVGTNDRYWVNDAMNLYWDDLSGQKYIRQVPNAGHGLEGGREEALTTLGVFFRHVCSGHPLPKLTWKFSEAPNQFTLTATSEPAAANVRLWVARSDDADFRDARWESSDLKCVNGTATGTVDRPAGGHVALFAEAQFDAEGLPWSLTTLVYRR